MLPQTKVLIHPRSEVPPSASPLPTTATGLLPKVKCSTPAQLQVFYPPCACTPQLVQQQHRYCCPTRCCAPADPGPTRAAISHASRANSEGCAQNSPLLAVQAGQGVRQAPFPADTANMSTAPPHTTECMTPDKPAHTRSRSMQTSLSQCCPYALQAMNSRALHCPIRAQTSKGMNDLCRSTPELDTSIRSRPAVLCPARAAPMLHPHRAGTKRPARPWVTGHTRPSQQQIFHGAPQAARPTDEQLTGAHRATIHSSKLHHTLSKTAAAKCKFTKGMCMQLSGSGSGRYRQAVLLNRATATRATDTEGGGTWGSAPGVLPEGALPACNCCQGAAASSSAADPAPDLGCLCKEGSCIMA